jgi:hypothetical protein
MRLHGSATVAFGRLLLAAAIALFAVPARGHEGPDDEAFEQQATLLIRQRQEDLRRMEAKAGRLRAVKEAPADENGPAANGQPAVRLAKHHSAVAAQTFDALVFGNRGETPSGVQSWLDSQLRYKIDSVNRVTRLTSSQRQKLDLAGRGDIKHFIDLVEEERRQFEPVGDDELGPEVVKELARTARRLKAKLNSELFNEGSLFDRVLSRSLTGDQNERSAAVHEIATAGGQISLRKSGADEVEEVVLSATDFADVGLTHLRALKDLKVLALDATAITDAGLAHLAGLSKLEVLDLSHTGITDSGLANLKGLTGLRTIYLRKAQVTDAGLVHLQGLENLEVVDLVGTQVTDAGLAHLKGLKRLKHLDLSGIRVTDAGLANLIGLTKLQRLFLDDTQVTDAGMAHLRVLKELRRLDLFGAAVSNAAVESLQRSVPGVKVFR